MARDKDILFVCGHRKSGTSLFLNLLDGHPEVNAIPADIALLYAYFPHWTDTDYSATERRQRIDRVLFDDFEQQAGDKFRDAGIDISKWRDFVHSGLSDEDLANIYKVLDVVIAGWQRIVLHGVDKKWLALKETGIEFYAIPLSEEFERSRFIQIVRDPRDNYAALKGGVYKKYAKLGQDEGDTLLSLLIRVQAGFKFASVNKREIGAERYRVVRFEDLIRKPIDTMEDTSDWLGLKMSDDLLSPTFLSSPTPGNNFDGLKFNGISSKNLGAWSDRISDSEAKVVEFQLGHILDAFGYVRQFSEREAALAWADFYKKFNHKHFFADRFQAASALDVT